MSNRKAMESNSRSDALNRVIPSAPAPYLSYDPPPSYEESLHHPIVPGHCNQASGFITQQKPVNQYSQFPSNLNAKQTISPYLEQPCSSVYPKQPPQFRNDIQYMVPGIQSQSLMQPSFYPGQNVIIPNVFDSGARFDSAAPPSIPPPPPGIAPNTAQLAVQHGATVVTSNSKSTLLSGGKGAGFTFW